MATTSAAKPRTPSGPCSAADCAENSLRRHLRNLLQNWRDAGLPPRWQLMNELQELLEWREKNQIAGLWDPPPLMLTATVDDGWGHGLEVVERCACAVGIQIQRIGLLQTPEVIVDYCRRLQPRLLGLTVLQFDSEAQLRFIVENLPGPTQMVAGGAPFQIDPEFAERAHVNYVAGNLADFLHFLLYSDMLQQQL